MAQAPPLPPYYPPPARPVAWQFPALVVAVAVAALVVVGFLVFFVTGLGFAPLGFPMFIFAPFCLFIVFVVIAVVWAASRGMMGSRIPPPPPIQQPMVPAGAQGPIALNCPNCGAPPQNVDRFGVATCPYCSTRFLVR